MNQNDSQQTSDVDASASADCSSGSTYDEAVKQITGVITGMSVVAAAKLLGVHGWKLREMKTEKGNCVGIANLDRSRFNVVSANGIIKEVLSVG